MRTVSPCTKPSGASPSAKCTPSRRMRTLAFRSSVCWSMREDRLGDRRERAALTGCALLERGQVVQTDDHVLRGQGHRTAIRRLQDVVRREHQDARLGLRLDGQRQVDCHLVAIEVGVERGTHERVQLDGLTLDELRLESLDAQSVQGWARGSAARGARG